MLVRDTGTEGTNGINQWWEYESYLVKKGWSDPGKMGIVKVIYLLTNQEKED